MIERPHQTVDRMLFCGTHRMAQLQRLKAAFDHVLGAAQTLRQGNKTNDSVRVVMIEGERGVGKTRLAIELYRYLTTTHDSEHYWPDSSGQIVESIELMPRAENCNYHASPEFLWWGVGVPDTPNPGNTVFASLTDLFPHLTAARISTKRRQSRRSVAAEIADLGLEFGLPAAEAALEFTGLGTMKNLGMAAWNIGSILSGQNKTSDDPLASGRQQVTSVVDDVLSDLARLFSPSARTFAGIPLVVLIDDAQFADKDTALANFTERLISQANQQDWPVLLVFTHWSRQLSAWTDGSGQRHQPSHIARALGHARHGSQAEPGPFSDARGGSIGKSAFLSIRLGHIEDDLSAAITARFPGLDQCDVEFVARKSGGNPRRLEQIMARMERKPRWFRDYDITLGLTETGRDAVKDLTDLSIDEVVLERFSDTPKEVRQAMILASFVGSRFVVRLVDQLSRNQLSCETRDDLEEAETNYKFLRGVVDKSRNDIGFFTERLFVDAAREYQDSGLAKSEIIDWPDRLTIEAGLDALLELVVLKTEDFEDMVKDDLAESLALAVGRLERTNPNVAAMACAKLASLEFGRGDLETAKSAALRFVEMDASKDRHFLAKAKVSSILDVFDVLELSGHWNLTGEIIETLLMLRRQRYLEVAADEIPDQDLYDYAELLRASFNPLNNEHDFALASFRLLQSTAIFLQLARRNPQKPNLRHWVSVGCAERAKVLSRRGWVLLALNASGAASKLQRELELQFPDNVSFQIDSIRRRIEHIAISRFTGDIRFLKMGLNDAKEVLAKHPTSLNAMQLVVHALTTLGKTIPRSVQMGYSDQNAEDAIPYYQEALGLLERMAEREPANSSFLAQIADVNERASALCQYLQRKDQAEEFDQAAKEAYRARRDLAPNTGYNFWLEFRKPEPSPDNNSGSESAKTKAIDFDPFFVPTQVWSDDFLRLDALTPKPAKNTNSILVDRKKLLPQGERNESECSALAASIAQTLKSERWVCVGVKAFDHHQPPFACTVGLWDANGVPELVVIGVEPRVAEQVLKQVVQRITEQGQDIPTDIPLLMKEAVNGLDILARPVDGALSARIYDDAFLPPRTDLPLVQLCLPDPHGNFPDDPDCDRRFFAFQDPTMFEADRQLVWPPFERLFVPVR